MVGVIGVGVMGSGIAFISAQKYKTKIWGRSKESIEKGIKRIEMIKDGALKRGKITEKEAEEIMKRIIPITDLHDLKEEEIIIESVAEDVSIKREIFEKIGRINPDCILATNTSTKSITELASYTENPERFIGLHFFNPPHIMRLVEVVKGVKTSEKYLEKAIDFAKSLGKIPVVVKDYPGFIVNHLLVPLLNHAIEFFESGVSAEKLTKITTLGLAHPMGPLELADLIGLDIVKAMGETLYEYFRERKFHPPISVFNLVKAGYLGRKTKKGFLDYQ